MNHASLLEWYIDVKKSTNCLNCGDSEKIEFHHVDPKAKLNTIFNLVKGNAPKHVIEKEMRKCVPLCRPCHVSVHKGETRGWLKDNFDDAAKAKPYMPFTPFKTKRNITVQEKDLVFSSAVSSYARPLSYLSE